MKSGDVSALLLAATAGDRDSESRLFNVVYAELKRMAAAQLRGERADHTLQPSALVHEAYIRLLGTAPVRWENRAHFFTTAAGTMRRILIDHARAKRARKRDGALQRVELEQEPVALDPHDADSLLTIDEALDRLAAWEPRQARVVELRFFGGLSVEEAAAVLQVSAKTVKRDWSMARAWLKTQIDARADGR
jgi:RNA polymerase sigma factor (TIGR02999 family)